MTKFIVSAYDHPDYAWCVIKQTFNNRDQIIEEIVVSIHRKHTPALKTKVGMSRTLSLSTEVT